MLIKNGKTIKFLILLLALLIIILLLVRSRLNAGIAAPGIVYCAEQKPFFETSYREYLNSRGYIPGTTVSAGDEIIIDILSFETSEGMNAFRVEKGIHTGDAGVITWNFDAEKAGYYNLEVVYVPESGTNSQIRRVIALDGMVLHDGLRQATFNRAYRDAKDTIEVKNRNEIRPKAVETFLESRVFISDSRKRSLEPYLFFLSGGKHCLSFESIKEPMIITGLRFTAAPVIPSYSDYIKGTGEAPYLGEKLIFQAERTGGGTLEIRKSLPSITIKNAYFDPALVPFHPYHIVFNTIGGDTWRYPGDIIEWDIDVPEDGLYKISFKARQSINRGVVSYRSLKINEETPFIEAQALPFAYSAVMKNYIPGLDGGISAPWLFHFKKGKNTISLEVVLGRFGAAFSEVNESVIILNDLYRRIIQITGTVPDIFIDYEISGKIPDYIEILDREYERLSLVVEELNGITVEKGSNTTMIERLVEQMRRLSRRPDNVTQELSQFKSNISALATWLVSVSEMPLELDSFSLLSPDAIPAPPRANFFARFFNDIIRFFATFFVDINTIDTDEGGSKDAVKVWFTTGRDQAQVLRGLIDERFIPEYNIGVNLELVPIEVVVPSSLAGVGPDVVLNLDQTRLMDFALRNALVDMSNLEGFNMERERYFPSSLEGITFQGKTFGLPETQTFLIMFYRRDIFDMLGIKPPDTWDEFRALISVLNMNNYDVYIPHPGPLASLIVQKGGNYYLGEGNDYGIESGLLEEPAMQAFKELTDFFTVYKLPVSMDFSNRFRTGEVPLGIAEYTEYCRLELFAPEIRGLWSFAPLPGTLKEDGTTDNRVVTVTTQTVILKAAEDRGLLEKAWTFVRWWLSTEIQAEYANGIEAMLGASARYATADRKVVVQLPWSVTEADKLLEQFASTKGIPPVPGNYMTSRMVDYAFNSVVAGKANARETLYLNTKDINAELTKKRREFNLSYINGGR